MSVQPSQQYRKSLKEGRIKLHKPLPAGDTARALASSLEFLAACKVAGVEPTIRQARKYRRGFGSASMYKQRGAA